MKNTKQNKRKGVSLIEYGILGAVIATGAITAASQVGTSGQNIQCTVNNVLDKSRTMSGGTQGTYSKSIQNYMARTTVCATLHLSDSMNAESQAELGPGYTFSTYPTSQEVKKYCDAIQASQSPYDSYDMCYFGTLEHYAVQGRRDPAIQDALAQSGYTKEQQDQDIASLVAIGKTPGIKDIFAPIGQKDNDTYNAILGRINQAASNVSTSGDNSSASKLFLDTMLVSAYQELNAGQ